MTEVHKYIHKQITSKVFPKVISFQVETLSIGLMWLFTCSALVGIGMGFADWFIPKTPINLLLGFLLLLINVPFGGSKGQLAFMFSFFVGMAVEIAGVATGDIFGSYYYGNNMGFKAWGVPLMIGIYWAILVVVTSQIARRVFSKVWAIVIAGALLMVGLDFLMEQVASTYDFWHFEGGFAHLQNYIAWFVISAVLQIVCYYSSPKGGYRFALHLYLNQIVFFVLSILLLQL